ncbi:MAG: DUF5908 family protein [Bacteroidota bacterium]
MPVEIFEMVIRANIGNSNSDTDSSEQKQDEKKQKHLSSKEIDERIQTLMNRKKER